MSTQNDQAFKNFMGQHRNLLDCYASSMTPTKYMALDSQSQKDFCYGERVQIEEKLVKGTIRASDFFKAVQTN